MARWGPTVRYNTTPVDFSGAVEGFMQARRDAQQNKRRQAMEERDSDLFDLDMLDRGYTRTDPALLQQELDAGITAPTPGQVGNYRKTGFSRDERAGIAKVAEQERVRQEADARRGRARGTAQRLGFQGDEAEFLADNEDTLARELLALRAAGRKPAAVPKFSELQDRSGEFVFFDPITNQRINSGVMGRVPGSGTGGGSEGINFNQISRLRGEFERKGRAYNIATTAAKQARDFAALGTGQGDIGLIYSYVKTLDPESVVREGEFAVATRAASAPDQIGNAVRRALSGQQLSPQQRQNLVKATETLLKPAQERYRRDRSYYSNMASRYGTDPYEVVGDDPDAEIATEPTASSVPALEDVLKLGTQPDQTKPPIREFINRNRPR